ncbi:MAG: D-2-hydroxyacid dehydrogenase [Clostridiales Family XIII bacterium]|jgi:phosphoglycerate dehydrogenase-like enzyme|nr:D-2-hydroxyacid dehydrogenase [Clostridiales Family XIII bacterium]
MQIKKIVFHTKNQGPGAFRFSEKHRYLIGRAAQGAELVFTDWDEARLMSEAGDCDVAVTQNNRPPPPSFYEAAKNLCWVHCLMAGFDKMRVPDRKRILFTVTKGIHAVPLAEHTLALMLSAARSLHISRDNQRLKVWSRPTDVIELCGATAGIVGFGEIGSAIAELLGKIGMRVIALSRSRPRADRSALASEYYAPEQMEDFLPQCDFVIIAAPLTDATEYLFCARLFAMMKPSAWLINIARGAIVVEADLVAALVSGRIAGACLDVAVSEPRPADDPLWELPNAILTPHCANASPKKMDRITELFLENLRRYGRNEPLLYSEE